MQRMEEIWLPAAPHLPLVRLLRKGIGMLHQGKILRLRVFSQPQEHVLEGQPFKSGVRHSPP